MILLLMSVARAGSSNESLLLNIQEFCELDVKPWNLAIGSIYTTEIDHHFSSGILSFESWFANTPLPSLPQSRRVTKEMAGKEIKVS